MMDYPVFFPLLTFLLAKINKDQPVVKVSTDADRSVKPGICDLKMHLGEPEQEKDNERED